MPGIYINRKFWKAVVPSGVFGDGDCNLKTAGRVEWPSRKWCRKSDRCQKKSAANQGAAMSSIETISSTIGEIERE